MNFAFISVDTVECLCSAPLAPYSGHRRIIYWHSFINQCDSNLY